MSDYALIFQIVGGLLLLFFFFLTYMNTKTWRWVHVTMMFFVFVAATSFMVFAALSLKTRSSWLSRADKLEKDLATKAQANELLLRGPANEVTPVTPSVISVREELGRVILDRGRVWRNTSPTINADGTVTLSMLPPVEPPLPGVDPATVAPAAPAGAPKKHNIEAKTVLHAFKEYPTAEGLKEPRVYLGEFHALAVTESSVTLAPTMPLAPEQAAEAGRPDGTWALYETAPIDGHKPFEGLDQAQLTALLPQNAMAIPPDQYQALIQQYLRDGGPADPNDPPENVWLEIKFLKSYEVPVDAVQAINTIDGQPFDTEGQAQLSRLRRGEAVKFKPGDTGVFDRTTADDLIAQGIAGEPKPIFRRKLNDYEYGLHAIHRRAVALDQRMKDLNRDIATIKDGNAKAQAQIAMQTDSIDKLNADLAKVTYEREELQKYTTQLDASVAAVKGQLSRLYASNRDLNRELNELSAKLTEEADRRTREATAMVE